MPATRKRTLPYEHPESSLPKIVRFTPSTIDGHAPPDSPTLQISVNGESLLSDSMIANNAQHDSVEGPPTHTPTERIMLDASPTASDANDTEQEYQSLPIELVTVPRVPPTAVSTTKTLLRTPDGGLAISGTRERLLSVVRIAETKYIYNQIKEDEVRLLLVKPGRNEDEINATLLVVPDEQLGTKKCQFEALSYHWGEGKDEKPIIIQDNIMSKPMKSMMDAVNGLMTDRGIRAKRLYVKPNLYNALKCLRQKDRITPLWVDALCINQPDEMEKKIQVNKMNKIYRNASNVCIWLGSSDIDSSRAMLFITDILDQENHESLLNDSSNLPKWASLFELLKWSWFSRRWIIQELALAQAATVHCGNMAVNWQDFKDAIGIFHRYFDLLQPKLKNFDPLSDNEFELNATGAKLLVDLTTNLFRKKPDNSYESTKGLETLVSLLSGFDTTDPRDTIHALRNISKEMNLTSLPSVEQPPGPDYSRDLFQVYRDFVEWVVKDSKSLDIICRHWALPEREQRGPTTPRLVKLPTWIQLVDNSSYGRGEDVFKGRRAGDSFVGMPGRSYYSASGTKGPNVEFTKESQDKEEALRHAGAAGGKKKQNRDMSMIAEGISLGKVSFNSQPFPDGVVTRICLEKLGWEYKSADKIGQAPDCLWRTLVADRDHDGSEVPTYFHRACLYTLLNQSNNGHINIKDLLRRNKSKGQRNIVQDYLTRVLAVTWNRCFIEGKDEGGRPKLVGLGPPDTEKHDVIAILYGCSVPVILRPISDPNKTECYEFVGEAYIYGKMDGEAMFEGYDAKKFKIT